MVEEMVNRKNRTPEKADILVMIFSPFLFAIS
jgi:hypothetical protein